MRFIMTIIWALLIGGALAYILASMAGASFNLSQSVVFSVAIVLGILFLDGVLKVSKPE